MSKKPQSRRENIVVQEYNGEVLIYDLENDRAFCLNETAGLVWQACDGTKTVSEISKWLGEKLNTNYNEDVVWLALNQLKREKLIENGAEIGDYFEGMSRREVIKKIGHGSMIALPLVASLVAPLVSHALSTCGGNCRCPNITSPTGNCAGSTTPTTINCRNTFTPACDCRGPFGAPDSAGTGFRTGMCSM